MALMHYLCEEFVNENNRRNIVIYIHSIKIPEEPITLGNDYPNKDILSFWNVHFLSKFSLGKLSVMHSISVLDNLL